MLLISEGEVLLVPKLVCPHIASLELTPQRKTPPTTFCS